MKQFLLIISLLIPAFGFSIEFCSPRPLEKGDTIAIISPASIPDKKYVERSIELLDSLGYVPVLGQNALNGFGTFSATINERLTDLKCAFETESIKAVLCTRGGYGSIQELCQVDTGYFAKHPKWLIGYSDITALHCASATDGVRSIHSHMCEYLAGHNANDTISTMLFNTLSSDSIQYTVPTHSLFNKYGTAHGVIVGGNLSVLNDVASSRIDILSTIDNDIILFIEDLDENISSISRILYRLKICGVFDRIKGLIVGDFHGYKPTKDFETMNEMIYSIVKEYNIPVAFDFPVGHIDNNYPIVEGADATLEVEYGMVTLTMKY